MIFERLNRKLYLIPERHLSAAVRPMIKAMAAAAFSFSENEILKMEAAELEVILNYLATGPVWEWSRYGSE